MPKRMTLKELERAFPNRWVVVSACKEADAVMVHDRIVHVDACDAAARAPAADRPTELAIWVLGKPLAGCFAHLSSDSR